MKNLVSSGFGEVWSYSLCDLELMLLLIVLVQPLPVLLLT